MLLWKKLIASLLLVLAVALSFPNLLLAQNKNNKTPMPASEIDSFELFWPISPGKTVGDPLFFLKTIKENLRGLVIFGMPQKANYAVLLATKRIVEAEKLMLDGKNDFASKSLDLAETKLNTASYNLDRYFSSEAALPSDVSLEMKNRLNNLEIFLLWLPTKHQAYREKFDNLLGIVKLLQVKI